MGNLTTSIKPTAGRTTVAHHDVVPEPMAVRRPTLVACTARADGVEDLSMGSGLFEEMQYEAAIPYLRRVLADSSLSRADRARAAALLGITHATL